jgi:pyruvate-formate lyase-activating enzyme
MSLVLTEDAPSRLPNAKFSDSNWTAKGERRAVVSLNALETLWFNTGTLCNIACEGCYIESSPRNDRLTYLTRADVQTLLFEAKRDHGELKEIGFTGGEPFMNPDFIEILSDALEARYRVLVLTNAMKPMSHHREALLDLHVRFREKLAIRVSLDHYTAEGHEKIRGAKSWEPAMDGIRWLALEGFNLAIASRSPSGESDAEKREGFATFFEREAIVIDAKNPHLLVLFPEMDESAEVPEITQACWGILNKSPRDVMCSNSRMVVKRKGADKPVITACTLLPYDERFEMGATLKEASAPVSLNHPHCAKFCVLGGASCSA